MEYAVCTDSVMPRLLLRSQRSPSWKNLWKWRQHRLRSISPSSLAHWMNFNSFLLELNGRPWNRIAHFSVWTLFRIISQICYPEFSGQLPQDVWPQQTIYSAFRTNFISLKLEMWNPLHVCEHYLLFKWALLILSELFWQPIRHIGVS